MRTFGVEEELLIVDPATGVPLALADALLRGLKPAPDVEPSPTSGAPAPDVEQSAAAEPAHEESSFSFELKLEQIETQTAPCLDYGGLLHQIRQSRAFTDQAARVLGARVAALATSPRASTTHTTPKPRYASMQQRFGLTVREQLTCGFHVHTSIGSPEEGVAVLDRIRDKLAVLIAISANSPFWNGTVTGFESYRTQAWNRWPAAGPSMIFGSVAMYRRVVSRLLETGVLFDEGMVYFDARLARYHPTVEVRVADVCLRAEDAALIAVLVRALVESASREWRDGVDPAPVPTVLLKMAAWQASNCGLRGKLLDFGSFRPAPAAEVVHALVEFLAPVLAEQGELELARRGVDRILANGTGSQLQRQALRAPGLDNPADDAGLAAVVAHAVRVTLRGADADTAAEPAPVLSRVRRG